MAGQGETKALFSPMSLGSHHQVQVVATPSGEGLPFERQSPWRFPEASRQRV